MGLNPSASCLIVATYADVATFDFSIRAPTWAFVFAKLATNTYSYETLAKYERNRNKSQIKNFRRVLPILSVVLI
jgi:hypothetical protein